MIRFLADENFNFDIVRELRRRLPSLDLVRIQELGLSGAVDPDVLELAANTGQVLLTHDVNTMTKFAYLRLDVDMPMPGVVLVPDTLPVGRAIEDLILMIGGSLEHEWENQVRHLPLR